MTEHASSQTRRETIATALAAAALSAVSTAAAQDGENAMPEDIAAHAHDWDWLAGRWNVRHRRLKTRLAGDTQWDEFNGASECWLTLGGFGTVDDNTLELPAGTYRAVGIRAFDPETRRWAIWWLDARYPTHIEPPVYGQFANGAGRFEGDDTFNGRPIKVYFQWSEITPTSARWEQAFSTDDGATWEVNWVMQFTRA